MRFIKSLLIVLSLLSSASVRSQEGVPAVSFFAPRISPIHLISKPEQYHGKRVKDFGYLHWRFEDGALYLSKDDADYLNSANAIWVSYDSTVRRDSFDCKEGYKTNVNSVDYFDGRYVTLEGTFNMKGHGHMGAFSGALENVVSVIEMRRWYDGRKELIKSDKDGRFVPQRKCK